MFFISFYGQIISENYDSTMTWHSTVMTISNFSAHTDLRDSRVQRICYMLAYLHLRRFRTGSFPVALWLRLQMFTGGWW